MEQNGFEIVSVIASRKAEFYLNARRKLLALLPDFVNEKEARLLLRRAISELDNRLFISEEEKASNTIKAGLSIKELKLNTQAILDRVLELITET
jgi:hypothetical protein